MTMLKRTLFCVFGVMQCVLSFKILFSTPYIIVAPLSPAFLKRIDFYKTHRSDKHGVI